jgi:hypothetical protein
VLLFAKGIKTKVLLFAKGSRNSHSWDIGEVSMRRTTLGLLALSLPWLSHLHHPAMAATLSQVIWGKNPDHFVAMAAPIG